MINAVKIQPSLDDLCEALEDAIYHVKAVKEALDGIPQYECWWALMDEVLDEMKTEFEPLEVQAQQEYDTEIADLTRDYYRSVI